jgi:HAD superfamily hydrolase (TIGR01549 family)
MEFASFVLDTSLEEVDVLSLDVFDTALTRLVEQPVDVFAIVEQKLGKIIGREAKGYAIIREAAETNARSNAGRRGLEEITFDDVLNQVAEDAPHLAQHREKLKFLELEAEHEVVLPVKDITELVDHFRANGKRVIFVSDMYLPHSAIASLLRRCGYEFSDHDLIVSSQEGCTKYSGRIWNRVKTIVGEQSRIMHVGDNERSDVIYARKHGINSIHYKGAITEHRRGGPLTPAVLHFSKLNRLEQLARSAKGATQDHVEFMRSFGRSWGAIVTGSFIRWLEARVIQQNIKHLAFCARDGYLIQQAWEAAGCPARTGATHSYLYVSRRTLVLAETGVPNESGLISQRSLERLTVDSATVGAVVERLGLKSDSQLKKKLLARFKSLNHFLSSEKDKRKLQSIVQENRAEVFEALKPFREATESYVCQELSHDGRITIVDSGWLASLQTSLAGIISRKRANTQLVGHYIGLLPAAQSKRHITGWMEGAYSSDYRTLAEQAGLYQQVSVIENLHLAPHGSTTSYKFHEGRWEPVLQQSHVEQSQYAEIILPFQESALEAIRQIYSGAHAHLNVEQLDIKAGLAAICRVSLSPTQLEMEALGRIHYPLDMTHTKFSTILKSPKKLPSKFKPHKTAWPMAFALRVEKMIQQSKRPIFGRANRACLEKDVRQFIHEKSHRQMFSS